MVCVLSTNTHFPKGRTNERKEVTGISEAESAAADEKHHEKLIVIVWVDLVGWIEKQACCRLSVCLSAKYKKAYFFLHNMLVDTNTSHCTQQVNQTRKLNFFSTHSHSISTYNLHRKKTFVFFFLWFHPKMYEWLYGTATLFYRVPFFLCSPKILYFPRYFSCF